MTRHVPERGFGSGCVWALVLVVLVMFAVSYCTGRFVLPGA